MRRHVGELSRAVSGRRDHLALSHQHRADRDLAASAGGRRFLQRKVHEVLALPAHRLASPETVC
jgi:hypothetical protein